MIKYEVNITNLLAVFYETYWSNVKGDLYIKANIELYILVFNLYLF